MNASVGTEELLKLIENSEDIASDWEELSGMMDGREFRDCLAEIMNSRGRDVGDLGGAALISRSFAYQLLSGIRIPGREIILRIAVGMELDFDETQRLLKLADRGILYPKLPRDAVIIFALNKKLGLVKCDELLRSLGQKPLI